MAHMLAANVSCHANATGHDAIEMQKSCLPRSVDPTMASRRGLQNALLSFCRFRGIHSRPADCAASGERWPVVLEGQNFSCSRDLGHGPPGRRSAGPSRCCLGAAPGCNMPRWPCRCLRPFSAQIALLMQPCSPTMPSAHSLSCWQDLPEYSNASASIGTGGRTGASQNT